MCISPSRDRLLTPTISPLALIIINKVRIDTIPTAATYDTSCIVRRKVNGMKNTAQITIHIRCDNAGINFVVFSPNNTNNDAHKPAIVRCTTIAVNIKPEKHGIFKNSDTSGKKNSQM